MNINTELLHAGVVREANGATLTPIYQSSAFAQDSAEMLEKIFENKAMGAAGVFEDLIRVSVGIEDIEDLKEDFSQAFAQL